MMMIKNRRISRTDLCIYLPLLQKIIQKNIHLTSVSPRNFGFLFDIDGVFLKGKQIIPQAKDAFKLLLDKQGKWRIPSVFVTNAGNMLRKQKAAALSDLFNVQVHPEQVVMSHSPLRTFTNFHNKYVLVCGQGPVKSIAKGLGFTNVITVDEIGHHYPYLDVCDHNRKKAPPCAFERFNKRIDAIVLFGEPVEWERNLQLLIDILMTNGQPYAQVTDDLKDETGWATAGTDTSETGQKLRTHVPVLACNMDLVWMSEAPHPRIGHGCFLHSLESIYEKLSGTRLRYTALVGKPSELTYNYAEFRLNQVKASVSELSQHYPDSPITHIYCVGDNPQTDIYGANLYNEYLQEAHIESPTITNNRVDPSSTKPPKRASGGSRRFTTSVPTTQPQSPIAGAGYAHMCESILVLTGVFQKKTFTQNVESLSSMVVNALNYNHRDFPDSAKLKKPGHIVADIHEAVKYVYEKEKVIS